MTHAVLHRPLLEHVEEPQRRSEQQATLSPLAHLVHPKSNMTKVKLCAISESFIWNDKSNILVALSDDRIYTWYYPNAVYIDRDL